MQRLTMITAVLAGLVASDLAVAIDGSSELSDGAQPKLSMADRNIFCGRAEEASRAYGIAVTAEITWRMAAGARTPAEAISAMRLEYCTQLPHTVEIK